MMSSSSIGNAIMVTVVGNLATMIGNSSIRDRFQVIRVVN